MKGIDVQHHREQQQRQKNCTNEAIMSATKSALAALAVTGGLYYLIDRSSEFFRKRFTVGAKASFVAMPAFYVFYLESERAVTRCSQRTTNRYMNLDKHNNHNDEQPPSR